MGKAVLGHVHGKTITLEKAIPRFDGRRVRVLLEPVEDDVQIEHKDQVRLWQEWLDRGPQGPIADDGEPEFP